MGMGWPSRADEETGRALGKCHCEKVRAGASMRYFLWESVRCPEPFPVISEEHSLNLGDSSHFTRSRPRPPKHPSTVSGWSPLANHGQVDLDVAPRNLSKVSLSPWSVQMAFPEPPSSTALSTTDVDKPIFVAGICSKEATIISRSTFALPSVGRLQSLDVDCPNDDVKLPRPRTWRKHPSSFGQRKI